MFPDLCIVWVPSVGGFSCYWITDLSSFVVAPHGRKMPTSDSYDVQDPTQFFNGAKPSFVLFV